MRDNLELKHIAPYLPYKLKMTCPWMIKENTLTLVCTDGIACYFTSDEFDGRMNAPLIELKPILRPLSDMIEDEQLGLLEVELHGQMSDAIHDWIEYFQSDAASIDNAILCAPYPVIEWACKNHYDIFSLIPKGLAVPFKQDKSV